MKLAASNQMSGSYIQPGWMEGVVFQRKHKFAMLCDLLLSLLSSLFLHWQCLLCRLPEVGYLIDDALYILFLSFLVVMVTNYASVMLIVCHRCHIGHFELLGFLCLYNTCAIFSEMTYT